MIVEKYYTVKHLAYLLEFERKAIERWVKDGRFGPNVVNVDGNDVRVPASGVQTFLHQQRVFQSDLQVVAEPVTARTPGELRRKLAERG